MIPTQHQDGPGRVVLDDPTDARLDDFRDLKVADDIGPSRRVVIAEGANTVERLGRSDYVIRAVVGVPAKLDALSATLGGASLAGVPVYEVDKWVLSEAVGFRVTRGVLASVRRPDPQDAIKILEQGKRFLVLERINDYENLGSIFRNAAAFGIDGVFLDARTADPLYRRSVRVSMGHVFSVPFAVLSDPWPQALQLLRSRGVELIALSPQSRAERLRAVLPADKWAVLLGAEGPGLAEATIALCDRTVRIPMADGVDSLNVATAGAVALAHLTS